MTKTANCKVCATLFVKARPLQAVCSPTCAMVLARNVTEKNLAKAKAVDRKETREKLDKMKGKPELLKAAQQAFNGFIRLRDRMQPCISCGKSANSESNAWDSGHFRSVGSAPHMRFVEENCAKQCKRCNQFLAGNHVSYRQGLIERIGLQAVERIEADTTVRKYTHDELRKIAKHYIAETRRLLKEGQ